MSFLQLANEIVVSLLQLGGSFFALYFADKLQNVATKVGGIYLFFYIPAVYLVITSWLIVQGCVSYIYDCVGLWLDTAIFGDEGGKVVDKNDEENK